ncbi:MAG: DUF4340 domain-containing protein [Fibrobacterota bacterium]
MNKKRQVLISGMLLAALTVVLLLSNSREQKRSRANRAPIFPDISAEKISRIEVSHGDSSLILARKNSRWQVSTAPLAEEDIWFPADTAMVTSVFAKTGRITREYRIAGSAEAAGELHVTPDSGKTVRLIDTAGSEYARFYIGKKAEIWSNSYFRRSQSKTAFSVGENIRFAYKCDLNEWRRNEIFTLAAEDVTSLTISYADTTLTLTRQELSPWYLKISGDDSTYLRDRHLVDTFLTKIGQLEVGQWLYSPMDNAGKEPLLALTLTGNSEDEKQALYFIEKAPDGLKYICTATEREGPFAVFNSRYQALRMNIRKILNPDADIEKDFDPLKTIRQRVGYDSAAAE